MRPRITTFAPADASACASDPVAAGAGAQLAHAGDGEPDEGGRRRSDDDVLQDAGVLANAVNATAIRMAPALTITDADIEQALQGWQEAAKTLKDMS